ncbi:hypothetical protein D9M68_751370 [compost metagenome]
MRFLGLGGRQQPQTQPGHPPFAALQQIGQCLRRQTGPLADQQLAGFFRSQAQILLLQLQQLPRQAQACQVPVRALAAGDQQQQPCRQMIEEKLQTAVQHRTLRQVVVVQHQ